MSASLGYVCGAPGSRTCYPARLALPHPHPCTPPGANNTYWGLSASNAAQLLSPPTDCTFGPLLNFIGLWNVTMAPGNCSQSKWTIENTGPQLQLQPRDLHLAQRERLRRWAPRRPGGPGSWQPLQN